MPLPLPDLDTRRWADLVDEGRALIPRYAPQWTDHNAHDPGITLVELFAWITEQLIYRANRIPERHLRKFLALAGFTPTAPQPARVVLSVSAGGSTVPNGMAWMATLSDGSVRSFQTIAATPLVEAALVSLQSFDGTRFTDLGRRLADRLAVAPVGTDPRPSTPALYLGFDRALPVGSDASLYVHVRGDGDTDAERDRLLSEADDAAAACARPPFACTPSDHPPRAWCGDDGTSTGPATLPPSPVPLPPHHSARTVWEYLAADGWHALDATAGEVDDRTRSLTLPGLVRLRLPAPTAPGPLGTVTTSLHWVRCRLVAGGYDETPTIIGITLNAVVAEQMRTAWQRVVVAPGTVASGPLTVGTRMRLALDIDRNGVVIALGPAAPGIDAPEVLVIDVQAATPTAAGSIALDVVRVRSADGMPDQMATLPDAPIARGVADVYSIEPGATSWRRWTSGADLDAAGDRDASVALGDTSGALRFGDGVHGRVPPNGATIVAAYASTAAGAGNVPSARPWTLLDDARNRALSGSAFAALRAATVSNPFGAAGGADEETVGAAAARAAAELWSHERLVEIAATPDTDTLDQQDPIVVRARPAPWRAATTLDIERIALDVPGTRVRRARAWAQLDPSDPCLTVPGTVTLVIVPAMPLGRPVPTAGLLRAVRRYVDRRRVLCTRLVVVGPDYLEVRVQATVRARRTADPARVQRDVVAALNAFLDPLGGGPAARGWPFGRDVYRSEILGLVDGVPGVDHVLALTLEGATAEGSVRDATCSNLCVPPTWLVTPGAHAVTVESA